MIKLLLLYLSSITSSKKVSPISLDHIILLLLLLCYYYYYYAVITAHRKCCTSYNNYHINIRSFSFWDPHHICFVHLFIFFMEHSTLDIASIREITSFKWKKNVIFSPLKSGFLTRPWIRKENYCLRLRYSTDPQSKKCSWTWERSKINRNTTRNP